MQLLYFALAAFAYRGLLTFGSQADLSRELEEWFFVPTETSPLVVVLLAGWLIYRRKERLLQLRSSPPAWGLSGVLAALALACFAWSLKTTATHLLAVSLLFGSLALSGVYFGRAGMRIVLLPALLLVFAVPMPAPLLAEVLYRFQLWTAESAGWMLFVLGRSAYVSGDQILLAQDHFQVIEGCSGLRSVQTLTMVAVMLVELFGRRGGHAIAIVVLAPIVAFALNGFRVLALILNPHSEVVAIHNVQGVAILLAGLAILYGVDGILARYEAPESPAPRAPETGGEPPAASSVRLRGAAGVGLLGVMCLLSLVLGPWAIADAQPISPQPLPEQLDGATGEDLDTNRRFLGTIGYRVLVDRRYGERPGAVDVFVLAGDLEQRYRSPISPKTVPPGSGWILEQRGVLEQPGAPGAHGPSWSVMRSGHRRVLIHHWYEGTQGLPDEIARALFAIDASPWHRDQDVLVVRLSTDIVGATEGALEAARATLRRVEGELAPALDRIRKKLSREQGS